MIFRIACQVRVPPSNDTLFSFFLFLSDLVLFVDRAKEKRLSLGEVLNGDRLVSGPFPIEFLRERKSVPVCKKKLSKEDVAKFRAVVHEDYYYQMYFDDLPNWVFLGMVDKRQQRYYLFNHIHLNIYYNKDRVIEITSHTHTNAVVELTEDKEVDVEFLSTVEWNETDFPFEKRMTKYSQSSSLPRHLEIHRNSVINSCMAVLLLAGFLAAILRILYNDSVK